jgi:hypothetical protein
MNPRYPDKSSLRRPGLGFGLDYLQKISERVQVGGGLQSLVRVDDSDDSLVPEVVASVGGRFRASVDTVLTSQFDTHGELRTQLSHRLSGYSVINFAYLHCPFVADTQNILTASFRTKKVLGLGFVHADLSSVLAKV